MHAFTGVGFLIATFIVRPFLPAAATAERTREDVCGGNGDGDGDREEKYALEYAGGVPKVAWPFLIAGAWCIVVSLIYVALGSNSTVPYFGIPLSLHFTSTSPSSSSSSSLAGSLPLEMPRFYETGGGASANKSVAASGSRIKHWKVVIGAVGVYYTLSCGIERIYQPMVQKN